MELLFFLRGKREEFVQGGAEGICEARWDGIGPSEDEDTPGAEGGVNLGDCGERFRRGEGIRGEERGAVNNRNLAHYSRWSFVSMKKDHWQNLEVLSFLAPLHRGYPYLSLTTSNFYITEFFYFTSDSLSKKGFAHISQQVPELHLRWKDKKLRQPLE
jgi:hypothetical protein